MGEIVNRVASSSLITLDLEELLPTFPIAELDIAPLLWQGLALKEQDFRKWVKEHNWSSYAEKHLAVHCSTDAIIPLWAFMLIASSAQKFALSFSEGTQAETEQKLLVKFVQNDLETEHLADKRIVVKGCADRKLGPEVYMTLVNKLQPVVKSIMFGEACSTVPVWKKPK